MCRICNIAAPMKQRKICKSCMAAYQAAHYKANRSHVLARVKLYASENSEQVKAYQRRWYEDNREKTIARACARQKSEGQSRYKNDLQFRISKLLRTRVLKAIKRGQKAGSAVRDLGCTIPELQTYLERLFQPGMSWENWSVHGWHIDHVKPLASFDLTDREQFLQACHYTNLQPLWAVDNLRKSDHV